uniref:SLC41A/MgtE integral membrane domain-containing protein n=1 Tax=Emiliania huxleyi TaxID=2903 RepID=A0A7S3STT1_EMIHU
MSLNSSTLIEQYPLIFSRESEQRSKHASAAGSDGISDGVFTERLRAHADEEYSSSVCAAVRSRLGWLALFLVGLWGAAFVIDWFEHMLQRNVELAHFVPLIIGHGGNAGSQAVGSVIRALAAKELDPSLRATFARVVSRETLVGGRCGGDTVDYDPAEYASFTLRLAGQMRREQVGGLCGVALGALFLSVGLLCHLVSFHVGVVVAVSLPLVSLWANFVGATLPLLAARLGSNPALTSAPLMTTVIDSSGLLIYFLVAWAYYDFGEAHHLVDQHHSLPHHHGGRSTHGGQRGPGSHPLRNLTGF